MSLAPMLDHALAYADYGWPVFPLYEIVKGQCACRDAGCKDAGKHPRIKGWPEKASTKEATIRGWWKRSPNLGIGIRTGDGVAVLDVDPDKGGDESLAALGPMPKTVESKTGGGGRHFFFSTNGFDVKNSTGKLGDGLDTRGDRGFVVAPPSPHVSGDRYGWVNKPSKTPLAAFPDDLWHRLSQNGSRERFDTTAALEGVQEGQRDDTLWSLASKLRQSGVPIAEAEKLVVEAAAKCDPPFDESAALDKVQRAYATYPPGHQGSDRNDLANAQRLVARHGGDMRYCHPWRKWLCHDDVRWREDDTGEVERRAKDTVRSIYQEAAEEADPDRQARLAKWAVSSASAARIRSMITLADSEPGIFVLPDELDTDPWLLNVLNGTIDMRTGELREHRPADLITKLAPVEYHPNAKAPTWLNFLDHIMAGRQELVDFLQRAVGYSLTGDTREQILLMLIGAGANGKSTFIEALLAMLGDYGAVAAPGMLLTSRGDRHPTEVAALQGRRLVSSMEVGEGRRFREELVKQLTGGDTLTARRMHEDFWSFQPTHKLWLTANYKPQIRGTDLAIWRRIMLIPFDVTIPPKERDKSLPTKLQAELPGILAWAVQGCLTWQENGLEPPKDVRAATQQYRRESDPLAEFITQRCTTDDSAAKIRAGPFYAAYRGWAEAQGFNDSEILNSKRFGTEMTRRFEPGRDKQSRLYIGVSLRALEQGIPGILP